MNSAMLTPRVTNRDEIMIVNGDVGIEMSFGKWYEFGVALSMP